MTVTRRLRPLLLAALCAAGGAARGDDWLVARHDPQRTGRSAGRVDLAAPTVRWRHYLGGALAPTHYTVTDIDADGVTDVVFVSSGKVLAKHADDALVWESPLVDARALSAVADLDGDGRVEVVITADRGNVLVLDGRDGRVVWELPRAQRGLGAHARLGDLDGDGRDELYVGQCVRNPAAAYALSFRDGYARPRTLWGIDPLPDACGTVGDVIGDLDGDGAPELVMAFGHDHMRVFDGRSARLAIDLRAPASGVFGTFSTPLLRELDGDPGRELVVVTNGWAAGASPFGARRVAVFDHVREGETRALRMLWEANAPDAATGNVAFESDSVVDLDGDGAQEVVFSLFDGAVRRWDLEVRDARTGRVRARRADAELAGVRDLDDDGRPELLVVEGDRATVILRWEGAGLSPRWSLDARRPYRALDLARDARERFSMRPLTMQLDDDAAPELILAPFDPALPPEARVVTSLEAWDVGSSGLRRLGRLDAPDGVTVLTASSGASLSRPYPQPVAVTSDGYLLALDREMVSTNRIVTAEFTVPGMRVGGYFSGSGALGHTPVLGGVDGSRAVIVRDARPALLRLDARGASLSSPARVRWSRPRAAYPALTDTDGDGAPEVVAFDGRDLLALGADDGAPRWTVRDLAPRGSGFTGDVVPLRRASAEPLLAVLRVEPGLLLRPMGLRARDGAVQWQEFVRTTHSGLGQFAVADLTGDGTDDMVFAARAMLLVDGRDGSLAAEGPDAPYAVQMIAPFHGEGPEVFTGAAARPDRLLSRRLTLLGQGGAQDFSSPYGAVVRCDGRDRVALAPIGTSEVRVVDPTRLRADGSAPEGAVLRRAVLADGVAYPSPDAVEPGARSGALSNLTAVADLDGRGRPGLLVGSTDGHLYALDACTLERAWAYDFRYPVGEPVVGDADGDGTDDVLVSVGDGYLYALGARTLAGSGAVRDVADESSDADLDAIETAGTVFASWAPVPGAARYHVRVLTASGTAVRFPEYVEVTGTRARIDELPLRVGGRYRVGVVAADARGTGDEILSDGFTVVDTSPPTVTVTATPETFAPRSGERAALVVRVTDRTGVARTRAELRAPDGSTLRVFDDTELRTPAPQRTIRLEWNGTDGRGAYLVAPGTYTVTATAEDVGGHRASATGTVTVVAAAAVDAGTSARASLDRGCACGVSVRETHPRRALALALFALGLRRRRRVR